MNTYSRPLTITYIRSLLVVFLPGLPSGRSPVLGCDALLPQIARQLLAISAYLSAFLTSEKAHARIFLWLNATSRKVLSFVAKRRTPGSGSRAAVQFNRALSAQQTSLLSLIKFNTSLQRVSSWSHRRSVSYGTLAARTSSSSAGALKSPSTNGFQTLQKLSRSRRSWS